MPIGQALLAKNRLCLVSDLDWTMVNHNDAIHESLLSFNRLWMSNFSSDSLLVFSTGRSPQLFEQLKKQVPLIAPDILVCSVGTEILIDGEPDAEWESHLNVGWDRSLAVSAAARLPELVLQDDSEQRPHKVSYKMRASSSRAPQVVADLKHNLLGSGLDACVIFSGGVDVDILPSRASKGKALSFLLDQIQSAANVAPQHVLVCGDSGNDIELFAVPGVLGCMVANAHPELREWCESQQREQIFAATQDGPAGIQQALAHFGLVDASRACPRRAAVVHLHAWFEQYLGGVPDANAQGIHPLDEALAPDFTMVSPQGSVQSRSQILQWFKEHGFRHRKGSADSVFRIWIDEYTEKCLAPRIWLVQYIEYQEAFVQGHAEQAGRTARRSCAILEDNGDDCYVWKYVHETWIS